MKWKFKAGLGWRDSAMASNVSGYRGYAFHMKNFKALWRQNGVYCKIWRKSLLSTYRVIDNWVNFFWVDKAIRALYSSLWTSWWCLCPTSARRRPAAVLYNFQAYIHTLNLFHCQRTAMSKLRKHKEQKNWKTYPMKSYWWFSVTLRLTISTISMTHKQSLKIQVQT